MPIYIQTQDFDLMEKQEIEADEFAYEIIKKFYGNNCAVYELMKKTADVIYALQGISLDPLYKPYEDIEQKRLEILKNKCHPQ